MNAGGEIFLQETKVVADEVTAKLQAIATTGYNERILVRGDSTAAYGASMQLWNFLQMPAFAISSGVSAMVAQGAITEGFDYVPHSMFAFKDCPCEPTRRAMPAIRKAVR